MDAREIESLSMLSRGFNELKEVNPELAYNVVLDILSGINESVLPIFFPYRTDASVAMPLFANISKPHAVSSHTDASPARAK